MVVAIAEIRRTSRRCQASSVGRKPGSSLDGGEFAGRELDFVGLKIFIVPIEQRVS